MTTPQRRAKYFPAWHRACDANWTTLNHRLVPVPDRRPSGTLAKVEEIAFARANKLGVTPRFEDYRHACHILALGEEKSSKDMTDLELDRVLAIFALLQDPDDLQATMDAEHPTKSQMRRIRWSICNSPMGESYVRAVARNKFGTARWESLNETQLRQLHITLKARERSRAKTT